MESQKIINLLEQTDDDNKNLKFLTNYVILLMIRIVDSMVKEIKMILLLNLVQKL